MISTQNVGIRKRLDNRIRFQYVSPLGPIAVALWALGMQPNVQPRDC